MGIIWAIIICFTSAIGFIIGAVAGTIAIPIIVIGWLKEDNIETSIETSDAI